MSRRSASAALEARLLESLRGLGTGVPCVGLLETAAAGEAREQDPTSLQVRVHGFAQANEALCAFAVSAEVRLRVEAAESADGALFASAHEAVALWLEGVMLGDRCVALGTDEVDVDGLRRTGGDMGFDAADGAWYAVWNVEISGRTRQQEVMDG